MPAPRLSFPVQKAELSYDSRSGILDSTTNTLICRSPKRVRMPTTSSSSSVNSKKETALNAFMFSGSLFRSPTHRQHKVIGRLDETALLSRINWLQPIDKESVVTRNGETISMIVYSKGQAVISEPPLEQTPQRWLRQSYLPQYGYD